MQTSAGRDLAAKWNIGTAACHIRCDRYAARLPGFGYDLRFSLVVSRIQHGMIETGKRELLGKALGVCDGVGTDQDRAAVAADLRCPTDDRTPQRVAVGQQLRRKIFSLTRAPKRDLCHSQTLHKIQFALRFAQRPAHSSQAQIPLEETLISNLRNGDLIAAGLAVFFELNELMQAA